MVLSLMPGINLKKDDKDSVTGEGLIKYIKGL